MLGGMRLKFLCDDCHALCETADEAARVGCSTITTVKRPTTKCSTAQRITLIRLRDKRSLHICHKKYSVWALALKAIRL